jgi:hypothetical protein
LHRAEAARHSGQAERLLRSTIWYERGVARYRHRRAGAAAWCLARALLLYPRRSAGLCRSVAGLIGVTAPREARPAA